MMRSLVENTIESIGTDRAVGIKRDKASLSKQRHCSYIATAPIIGQRPHLATKRKKLSGQLLTLALAWIKPAGVLLDSTLRPLHGSVPCPSSQTLIY